MEWLLLGEGDKKLSLPIYRQLLSRLYQTPRTVMVGSGALHLLAAWLPFAPAISG